MRTITEWWAVAVVIAACVAALAYAFVLWQRDARRRDHDEE